ncbi:MAG: hypothetical protein JNK95_12150 [Candidatus Competibacter sp.]|nr:hypothetical protein [Candidatus Competibacter sp.]MDG4605773.1 hypothetical protein [Candidatus Contendobacter sp.]HRD48587.1 hypothetical protein [Candidatus Contendobacter sp.]
MKARITILPLILSLCAGAALAQDRAQPPQSRPELQDGRGPPPQAYADCKGKKTGDAVQHTTPEGKVAATCEDSPQGLVARPNQPPGAPPNR